MANSAPFTVFVDTSFNTHLGMFVSCDDSVAAFKRKIEDEHLLFYPQIGEVTVRAIQMFREGRVYRLSDSMLVHTVFAGVSGTWRLSAEAASANAQEAKKGKSSKKRKKTKMSEPVNDASHQNVQAKTRQDHGVVFVEKKGHKKAKVVSAQEKESSKERESNPNLAKEISKGAKDASFNNAGGVAFPASDSSDPNETAFHILADLNKRSPIPPNDPTNEDVAPQMQLLANVAVDQHKVEHALGPIVETKKQKRKSKKQRSNKTETSKDTMNLATRRDAVNTHNEKKRHEMTKVTFAKENQIESKRTFVLALLATKSETKEVLKEQKSGDDSSQNLNSNARIKPISSVRFHNLDPEKTNTIDYLTPDVDNQPSELSIDEDDVERYRIEFRTGKEKESSDSGICGDKEGC